MMQIKSRSRRQSRHSRTRQILDTNQTTQRIQKQNRIKDSTERRCCYRSAQALLEVKHSHSPFLNNFDINAEHGTPPDHHLRPDPPVVSSFVRAFVSTRLSATDRCTSEKWRQAPSVNTSSSSTLNTTQHAPLSSLMRSVSALLMALVEICLGRTRDRQLKGERHKKALLPCHSWRLTIFVSICDASPFSSYFLDLSPFSSSPSPPELTLFSPLAKKNQKVTS